MKNEYLEAYEILFNDSYNRLYQMFQIKLEASRQCQKQLDNQLEMRLKQKLSKMMKISFVKNVYGRKESQTASQ